MSGQSNNTFAGELLQDQNGMRRALVGAVEDQGEQVFALISARLPVVALDRISEEEINSYLNRGNVRNEGELSGSDDNRSQFSSGSDSDLMQRERIIFTRYEFVNRVRASTKLIFVYDNEQLYSFRHKNAIGSVYGCRKRKNCNAKVLVNLNGTCNMYTIWVCFSCTSIRSRSI